MLLFVIAVSTYVISCSNKMRFLLQEWMDGNSNPDVLVFENLVDYNSVSQYIDPTNTTDPLLVSTAGSIIFNPSTSYDEKVQNLKTADFTDKFIQSILNTTNMTNQSIISVIQMYILSMQISDKKTMSST